jgi:hypothetical protein
MFGMYVTILYIRLVFVCRDDHTKPPLESAVWYSSQSEWPEVPMQMRQGRSRSSPQGSERGVQR